MISKDLVGTFGNLEKLNSKAPLLKSELINHSLQFIWWRLQYWHDAACSIRLSALLGMQENTLCTSEDLSKLHLHRSNALNVKHAWPLYT